MIPAPRNYPSTEAWAQALVEYLAVRELEDTKRRGGDDLSGQPITRKILAPTVKPEEHHWLVFPSTGAATYTGSPLTWVFICGPTVAQTLYLPLAIQARAHPYFVMNQSLSGQNVTVQPQTGGYLNWILNGTKVLAPGQGSVFYSAFQSVFGWWSPNHI